VSTEIVPISHLSKHINSRTAKKFREKECEAVSMQEKAVRKVRRTGRSPLVKGRPLSHHPFRTLAIPTGGGGGASAEGGRRGAAASQPKGHHFHNYFGENLSDSVGGGSHRPQRQQPRSLTSMPTSVPRCTVT